VVRKAMLLLIPAMLAALVGSQWPDIMRYLKIRQMSQGQGHPENVPAEGTIFYPQDPAGGAPDGTGEFASASRGGPA
jgi:hypothetical protein